MLTSLIVPARLRLRTLVCASLLGLVLPHIPARAAESPRFVQDRLAIAAWVDPPMNTEADKRYAELAGANFNVVFGGFGARTPAEIKRQLGLGRKHGLKVLPYYPTLPADNLPTGPACWGYFVRDEPTCSEIPALRETVSRLRQTRPGHLAWINLFPNYASPEQLGAKTYEEYVRRFADEVDVDVLCMDHYPLMSPAADTRDGYCANLEVMRKVSLAKGIPFWNFFNTLPFDAFDDPTEAQIRWQVFASLAYGAKGVIYFCYWNPPDGGMVKNGGIITTDGRRTRHYEHARRLNGELQRLGPVLMKLTSIGVCRVRSADDPAAVLAATPVGISKGEYLIGVFRHADGRQAVMINNHHFAYTQWPTVEFKTDRQKVREIDPQTGRERPVLDESPKLEGLQISLDAAASRLFLLPAPKP